MSAKLAASIVKKNTDIVNIQIKKEDFESFCNAAGLFKEEFLEILSASDKDHQEGRIKERKSLMEIVEETK
ncbi:hypothetical protein KKC52_12980 [bacterium]|nr:hypothetical protein [bacterium]